MERLEQSLDKDYLPVKLRLEDLESIQHVLAKAKGFSIEAAGFRFVSVEELKEKKNGITLTDVIIRSVDPFITIFLARGSSSLRAEPGEAVGAGMFHHIDAVLTSARRQPAILYTFYTVLIVIALMVTAPRLPFPLIARPWIGVFSFVGLAWICWLFYVRLRRHSIVVIAKKGHPTNFFSRNKDQLIVGLITVLLSIFGTAMLTANYPQIQDLFSTLFKLE
ncbi:MAG TPA: hypothetical protein VKB53_00945 [Gammaproteobacteria bacterium]|jgi:hypothetical protein|nr:hypothetical protein [Gammaproteobacteria bacterium]